MEETRVSVVGSARDYNLKRLALTAREESINPGDMVTSEEEVLELSKTYQIARVDAVYPQYGHLPYTFLGDNLGDYTVPEGQEEFASMQPQLVGAWNPPPEIAKAVEELRATNPKVFKLDQELTCLHGVHRAAGKNIFEVSRGLYSHSFYSNGAEGLFVPSRKQTLRGIVWEAWGGLPPLHCYNNNIGNAGMVLTNDGYYVFVLRGKNVSVNKGINCTSSGAVKWDPLARENIQLHLGKEMGEEINEELGLSGGHILMGAMQQQVWLELGIEPGEYRLIPVGFIRELPRGGKPEIMFLIRYDGELLDLVRRILENAHLESAEVEGIYAQKREDTDAMLRDPATRNTIQHKGRVNLLLCEEYLANLRIAN